MCIQIVWFNLEQRYMESSDMRSVYKPDGGVETLYESLLVSIRDAEVRLALAYED